MQVYSIFLDKDVYFFNGPCYLNGIPFKNLSEFVNAYLTCNKEINNIYIAGACYSSSKDTAEKIVSACFGTVRKYNIGTISEYTKGGRSAVDDAIKKYQTSINLNPKDKKDHRKMVYFLVDEEVVAILIGSSNFSKNTYLTKYSSEADLMLLKYEKGNSNEKLVKSLENDIQANPNGLLVSKSLRTVDASFLQKIFEENMGQLKK